MIRQNRGRIFTPKTLAMVEGKDRLFLYAVCPFSLTPAEQERLRRRPDLKLGACMCAAAHRPACLAVQAPGMMSLDDDE